MKEQDKYKVTRKKEKLVFKIAKDETFESLDMMLDNKGNAKKLYSLSKVRKRIFMTLTK